MYSPKGERISWWNSAPFSRIDRTLGAIHKHLFRSHPVVITALVLVLYAFGVVFIGPLLGVSANYLVIAPVLVSALAFGTFGGLIAGIVALPLNLALFDLLGHPEYSPASKAMAEFSGILVGFAFGYLSDYFLKLNEEIQRRRDVELSLRRVVAEKEALLSELQHRVRNNLNVLGSLVRLQASRAEGEEALSVLNDLSNRLRAMTLAHEALSSSGPHGECVIMAPYLRSIAETVTKSRGRMDVALSLQVEPESLHLPSEVAVWLGLILNEIVTNALKHAWNDPCEGQSIDIRLIASAEDDPLSIPGLSFSIADDGIGCGVLDPVQGDQGKQGLGHSIVDAIASRLHGTATWSDEAGTRFELTIPRWSSGQLRPHEADAAVSKDSARIEGASVD